MHEDDLEPHRAYLTLVARLLAPPWLRAALDPEDLVQQTFAEALANPAGLPPADGVRAWLRTALRHNALDALKRGGKSVAEVVRLDDSSARLEAWLAAGHSSPSERAARQEQLTRLAAALAGLPEEQRTAVEYKHLQGLPVAEVARLMGRSEAAVGGLLRRGLAGLRGLLSQKE
jgi:RNA polymerase sigma-70 factor (ECF subfamily)